MVSRRIIGVTAPSRTDTIAGRLKALYRLDIA